MKHRYLKDCRGGCWRLSESGKMEVLLSGETWSASEMTLEDVLADPWPAIETDIHGIPLRPIQPAVGTEAPAGVVRVLTTVMRMILDDLPRDHAWLNPATESTARSMVRLYGGEEGRVA